MKTNLFPLLVGTKSQTAEPCRSSSYSPSVANSRSPSPAAATFVASSRSQSVTKAVANPVAGGQKNHILTSKAEDGA
jgi:hypothetical protein